MMVIDPAFRSASVARPLYFKTVNALKRGRIPELFHAIGPLVEWRTGDATRAGRSERVQTLSWF